MDCPRCQSDNTRVLRTVKSGDETIRERRCNDCNVIFYTKETVTQVSYFNVEKRKAVVINKIDYDNKELYNRQ